MILISGLSRNIPTVVGIMCRGNGFDFRIYAWLIVINIYIYTKCFCGGGGLLDIMIWYDDVIKVIECPLVQRIIMI